MKKRLILLLVFLLTTSTAFGAKFKVNKSGTVKTQSGSTVSSPSNTVNQNYYNNYYAPTYISQNLVNSSSVDTIEFVMDFSGSMANWIGVAKRSMTQILTQVPNNVKIGFRVFGHDNYGSNPYNNQTPLAEVKKIVKKGNKFSVITEKNALGSTTGVCSATNQVSPIMLANSASIISGMNSVVPGGATPLVYALDRTVYQDFKPFGETSPKKIVLITDGGENCGGDPCAFAKKLMTKRSDVHIDVVLVSSYSKNLSCLATTTGGHFYNINNLSDFTNTITNSLKSEPVKTQQIQDNSQNFEFIKE